MIVLWKYPVVSILLHCNSITVTLFTDTNCNSKNWQPQFQKTFFVLGRCIDYNCTVFIQTKWRVIREAAILGVVFPCGMSVYLELLLAALFFRELVWIVLFSAAYEPVFAENPKLKLIIWYQQISYTYNSTFYVQRWARYFYQANKGKSSTLP